MKTFKNYFGITLPQSALDFVDIPVNADVPLFVDPFAISQRPDVWSKGCHDTIINFFDRVLTAIRGKRDDEALELLRYLTEPNETHLGFSSAHPRGAGIGTFQAEGLFNALKSSSAVKTGFLNSLAECELVVDGVGRDKISDLTTNIIRRNLAEYSKQQANLHCIPTVRCALKPYFDPEAGKWISDYFDLPVVDNAPILLVPRIFARYDSSYDHREYYSKFVLDFLQAEHISANSALVHALKSGKMVVYKKELAAHYPCTKTFLLDFSQKHPTILEKYREVLKNLERSGDTVSVSNDDQIAIAKAFRTALSVIRMGSTDAGNFHNLMIGILEFIFFPDLLYPTKELEINDGRKRIDIVMRNGAYSGIFDHLNRIRKIPCPHILFECKNYTNEIANPELDQMAGRFAPFRSKVGFICARRFEDRSRFIKRCKDTFREDRGVIIPLDDERVSTLLGMIENIQRPKIEEQISAWVDEVTLI